MMDSRGDDQPEELRAHGPVTPTQGELEAMFDADDVDLAAGRIVPAEPVLAEMRATAARIRHDRNTKGATTPRRA